MPISQFGTFIGSNPPGIVSPGHVFNIASRQNYDELTYFWRGQKQHKIMQGGGELKGRLFMEVNPRAEVFDHTDTANPQITQPGKNFSLGWAKIRTYIAWDDIEVDLNSGTSHTADYRFEKWWDDLEQYYQDMYTDWYGKIQDLMWAVPNKTTMEATATTVTQPYSIPCFINEHTNGLAVPGAANGGTWTTVEGIAPATDPGGTNWVPQKFGYKNRIVNDPDNLLNALDYSALKLKFTPPPMDKKYFEEGGMSGVWYATSATGRIWVEQLYRASNDRWDNPNDPAGNPVYKGYPFVYCAKLDSAAIFPTSTAGAYSTELITTNGNAGARFFAINPSKLNAFTHSNWFMKQTDERHPFPQPTMSVIWYITLYNMMCTDRRGLGIIYPTANVV